MGLSATPYRTEKALQNSTPCWTDRAWVLQEFALGSSPQICFDRTKLSYERYHSYDFGVNVPREYLTDRLSGLLRTFSDPLEENIFGPPIASHCRPLQGILALARKTTRSQTSNLHDKVFALLGLVRAEEAREITVDYNIPFWVTCARATYASAKHNRDKWLPLGHRYARLNVLECASWTGDSPSSFPSWVADFSQLMYGTSYEEISTSFDWPGSEDHYDVSLSPDLRCLTTYGVMFSSVAAYFTLYSRLDFDGDDSASIDARRDDDASERHLCFSTGDFVPAVQATLLAELTSLASQNRGPVEASDLGTSKRQAEMLSNLVLQLETQQQCLNATRHVTNEDALDLLQTCFAYWQSALASQQSPHIVPQNPRSYELQVSASDALYFFRSVRLFASSNGYVGFAPGDVEPGDTIVFLRGAEWPTVLRQYEDRWIFRGFVYLCGVMHGELKDGDGLREWKVEPFLLC
ncbi:hypothetical protein LTS10_012418 [Elasticomyces elasticus]|nr:hypothetical protein LTS10_012418 [Elasticomyces elasticus]